MTASDSSLPAIKAFCVGQAKSGTASLAALLAARHRAAHEPEREQILGLILREARGDVPEDAVRAYLLARDRRLNLEYDIAWANQFIVGHLLAVFPDARFIILVRDPYTWLQSIIGHLASREIPTDVRAFLDWWFRPDLFPSTRHERGLQALGTYSLAAYLHAWNRHITACTQLIPPGRRLILRTHELGAAQQQLAAFLQIPVNSLDVRNGHINRGTWLERIDLVQRSYLDEVVQTTSGVNMARYFPEIGGVDDAYELWRQPAGEA